MAIAHHGLSDAQRLGESASGVLRSARATSEFSLLPTGDGWVQSPLKSRSQIIGGFAGSSGGPVVLCANALGEGLNDRWESRCGLATVTGFGVARAQAGLGMGPTWRAALTEALTSFSPTTTAPDLVFLFASSRFAPHFPDLLRATRRRTGARLLAGCSVSGYLANGVEVEHGAGLSLLALWLPRVTLCGVRLDAETQVPDATELAGINGWVMFADPARVDTLGLIQRLKRESPGRPVAGGMAASPDREQGGVVFLNDEVYPDGAVAVGIGGPWTVSTHVSQSCFPIGESWTVTEVQRNVLLGISNRPAIEMLQRTIDAMTPAQREMAPGNVMTGLAVDEYLDQYDHGDFMMRGILGVDQRRGGVVIGGLPRVGQTMQFHLRDRAQATSDLAEVLRGAAAVPGEPVATLLCTCEGRGSRVFGEPHHDSRLVQTGLPGVPLAGAFLAGEIGPLGKTIVLHGFTATLAVIRAVS